MVVGHDAADRSVLDDEVAEPVGHGRYILSRVSRGHARYRGRSHGDGVGGAQERRRGIVSCGGAKYRHGKRLTAIQGEIG